MPVSNVGVNIAEKATLIWNVADMLRGPFKPHEYGLVILPMTVVKRFHDCLLPTHGAVLAMYEKVKHMEVVDGFLTRTSGCQFYNTSKYTFETLLADPENIEANFRDYLAGFSGNVQDVLAKFEFDNIIKRMVESNTLYLVIKEFNSPKGYLGPDKISAVDCGYVFEDLVRRFNESYGEEAGAHFTSRDIIYLMTDILLADTRFVGQNITVYDMTMGTSQMLSCMEERIHALDEDATVTCFGQEFNPSTFAIAKADMMIRGGDPNNMRFGDTLSEDKFSGYTFDRIISNPPFGIDWKREQKAVEAEAKLGENGRFAPGLPKISDGQQLFVLNGLAKLAEDGKMAIVQNGSPLFSGDAGSGPSEIRRYILENDWLDAIIYQLQKELHDYNLYSFNDIEAFCAIYYSGKKQGETSMGKMTSTLKPVQDRYNALSPDERYNFRRQVRSYIKWYGYISQVCRMFDAEMQKEYVFCSYLVKLLPADVVQMMDIEGALKLEYYKLEQTFKGDIVLIDGGDGDVASGSKRGNAGPEQKEPLEEVIQKINDMFSGEFGDADRVILYALHERLRTDKKLEKKAQSSDPQIFAQSIFPGAFESAAMDGYVEQTEAYTSLFQNKSKYNAMMAALAGLIYREFNAAQGGV